MPNWTTLPYQKLIAYQVARELVVCVRDAKITDSKLRDQAMRAAITRNGGEIYDFGKIHGNE